MRVSNSRAGLVSASLALVAVGCFSGVLFFWLWRDWTLYALFVSAFLLFGGVRMLSDRNVYVHAASIGFCIGAFIGGGFGVAALYAAVPSSAF